MGSGSWSRSRREAPVRPELSDRLVRLLGDDFSGSVHVRNVGLARADDEDVWRYAVDGRLVIASKDSDFHQRSLLRGHPPKVVWVRTGNCTTDRIGQLLRQHREDLEAFAGDAEASFLILS